MKELFDRAVVVKITPYGDDDAILECFFETSGIVSLVAKGLKKPTSKNKGICRIGSIVGVEYFLPAGHAPLGKLKRLLPEIPVLMDDFASMGMLMLVCEMMQMYLPKDHPEILVFRLYEQFLQTKTYTPATALCFLITFFKTLGMLPDFASMRGERVDIVYWDEKHGVVKERLAESNNYGLSWDALKVFYHLSSGNFQIASSLAFSLDLRKEVWNVLWWFHQLHVSWFPKSKKTLESMGIL